MRVIGAFILAGLVAALPGCLQRTYTTATSSAPPEPPVALPAPSDCVLGDGSLPELEASSLGLLESLREEDDPELRISAALLAGSTSHRAGDWERAYAFCALVPATAEPNHRVEAVGCRTKAAVSMGRARTACADLLARQWLADPNRIGLGFAPGQ